jgi:hypothetical protein
MTYIMNTIDITIAVLIITASVLYLGRLLLKTVRGAKGKSCNHCS